MKRLLSIVFALLLACAGASAGGIDPARDSVCVAALRARMDSIRVAAGRPTVALVLSGGGAKGAAHAGAIKYLMEEGIPVDLVLGTSMGGLMGGLFAAGYTPEEMEEVLTDADWKRLLFDKTPVNYISYSERRYKEKYQISLPFFYAKSEYEKKIEDDLRYTPARHSFSLGADDPDRKSLRRDNLWESLPSGYTFGQNVGNMLSSLLVGYQDEMSFSDLPIPFVCVASDAVSCKPKVWYEGKLTKAMRSTMAIPVLFTPVRTDGMVLLDGGMRNNYPVDIARDLGADIVIGIELSDASKNYAEVNNIGDILSQLIDMLGSDQFEKNKDGADIKIKPDLAGYNMLSFDAESIKTIIERGYDAACEKTPEIRELKSKIGADSLRLAADPAINMNKERVIIGDIVINGVTDKEREILMRKIKFESGEQILKSDIDNIVTQFYGTQCFDYVSYELLGDSEPFRLEINCKKGPVHQLGIGIRLDTEEIASAMINFGLWTHRLHGSALDFDLKVSANPYIKIAYTHDGPKIPTFGVSTKLGWTDLSRVAFTADKYSFSYLRWISDVSISNIKWYNIDMNLGVRNNLQLVRDVAEEFTPPYTVYAETGWKDYVSAFFEARGDTFDHGYFPTKGFTAGFSYEWDFWGNDPAFKQFHALALDAKVVVPGGKVFAFIPSLDVRWVLGKHIPVSFMNYMGGTMKGRYFDHQFAFVGYNYLKPMGNLLAEVRTDFRFNVAKNHYITAIADYAQDGEVAKNFVDHWGLFGAGIEYSYNTIFGPISANFHYYSPVNAFEAKLPNFGIYISAGLVF